MARTKYDPNPAWPVSLWKRGFPVSYAHNDKELEQMLLPERHPKAHPRHGGGWSETPIHTKYPVILYHPTMEPRPFGEAWAGDEENEAVVATAFENGWQRDVILRPEKEQVSKEVAAKMADQKTAALEAQVAQLTGMVTALLAGKKSKEKDAA